MIQLNEISQDVWIEFSSSPHCRIDRLGDWIVVTTDINALSDSLIDEIIRAFGLPKTARLHRTLAIVFHRPIEQFSSGGVTFDQMVESVL
jgi:hypothetical protein